jgi:hypothetical protein
VVDPLGGDGGAACSDLTGYENENDCIFQLMLDPTIPDPDDYKPVCSMCETKWATAFPTRFENKEECREAMCHDCQKCEYAFASEFNPVYADSYTC